MSGAYQRRDKRYHTRLAVRTRIAGRAVELFTDDVSFRGLFLCTAVAPPLRQLIKVEALLPPGGAAFAAHGMVVHVVTPDDPEGRPTGVGLQFYGMGDERKVWDAYIQHVQQEAAEVPDRRAAPRVPAEDDAEVAGDGPTMVAPEPAASEEATTVGARAVGTLPGLDDPDERDATAEDHRRFQRFDVVLEVRPADVDELFTMYTRDVSVGGMFLGTRRELEVGRVLRLDVRHPTSEAVFSLSAVVRRCSVEPVGVGVEFIAMNEQRRREFFDFIHAPIPAQELEDDLALLIETE